ncbi:hypothetical protein B0H19DRAFT_1289048 [Mycena capillaripes]|nr:hypothetical protein B0H19DRAFT_1289048 [Mycena capillaripes]
MFIKKSLLVAISAAIFVGATAFTGSACIGFTGTTFCGCPAANGPFLVSIASALFGNFVCCQDSITVTHNGKSVTAILSGVFDAGAGTHDIQVSAVAFAGIEDNSSEFCASVSWEFN